MFVYSTFYAGDDKTSTLLASTPTSPDSPSILAGVSTTQSFTTRYFVTTTEKTVSNADVNTTSEGYSSTLGKDVLPYLFQLTSYSVCQKTCIFQKLSF
jgi:hypothetical protein